MNTYKYTAMDYAGKEVKAAGERHADGCIKRSIEINTDRFELDGQLVDILNTTAESLEQEDW